MKLTAQQIRLFLNFGELVKDLEIRDVDGKHKLQPPYKEKSLGDRACVRNLAL